MAPSSQQIHSKTEAADSSKRWLISTKPYGVVIQKRRVYLTFAFIGDNSTRTLKTVTRIRYARYAHTATKLTLTEAPKDRCTNDDVTSSLQHADYTDRIEHDRFRCLRAMQRQLLYTRQKQHKYRGNYGNYELRNSRSLQLG